MFNNANVLFRTKFVDGVSTISRTVPGGAAARSANSGREQPPAKAAAPKRAALTSIDA